MLKSMASEELMHTQWCMPVLQYSELQSSQGYTRRLGGGQMPLPDLAAVHLSRAQSLVNICFLSKSSKAGL